MSAPDLSAERQYAEAVAYGRLLAVRELLDALHEDRPAPFSWVPMRDYDGLRAHFWRDDYIRGYDRAVKVVKAMRLGVEKVKDTA